MKIIRQGSATQVWVGPLVEATDGYSYKATTITIAAGVVRIIKVSGLPTETPGAVSLPIPGWMSVPLAATDTDLPGLLKILVGNVTSNIPAWYDCEVIAAHAYDVRYSGTIQSVNVAQVTGIAVSTALIHAQVTGVVNAVVTSPINANVVQITGADPSTVLPRHIHDYVMSTPGTQSLTLRDYYKMMGAALFGKADGASGVTGVQFYGPSGEIRINASGVDAHGNRTIVTWVTG